MISKTLLAHEKSARVAWYDRVAYQRVSLTAASWASGNHVCFLYIAPHLPRPVLAAASAPSALLISTSNMHFFAAVPRMFGYAWHIARRWRRRIALASLLSSSTCVKTMAALALNRGVSDNMAAAYSPENLCVGRHRVRLQQSQAGLVAGGDAAYRSSSPQDSPVMA